jgi:hypothetical protein
MNQALINAAIIMIPVIIAGILTIAEDIKNGR